jgi:heme oxygenase (biliverdin-IX-beta and delta-forming)
VTDRRQALRSLLSSQRHGVLATLSARYAGWPFASVTPYALTEHDEPILLLSTLAEHTRNVLADTRASLFVQDDAPDPQAAARVTLLGRVAPVSQTELSALRERYLERHPTAANYFAMADFGLYLLRPEAVRFVGGFGEMGWVTLPRDA